MLKSSADNECEMLQCYLYSYFRAKVHLSLPVEPSTWPVVTNTIAEIKREHWLLLRQWHLEPKQGNRAQRCRFIRLVRKNIYIVSKGLISLTQQCLRLFFSELEGFSRCKALFFFTQQVRFGLCCEISLLAMSRDWAEPRFGKIRAAVGNGDLGRAPWMEFSSSGNAMLP